MYFGGGGLRYEKSFMKVGGLRLGGNFEVIIRRVHE
jgi:hypothetical protein